MSTAKSNLTGYNPFGDLDDLFKGFMLRPVRFETASAADQDGREGREGEVRRRRAETYAAEEAGLQPWQDLRPVTAVSMSTVFSVTAAVPGISP